MTKQEQLWVVCRWHRNGADEVSIVPAGWTCAGVVERMQRRARAMGYSDGITFQAHRGGLVSALVASAKL